MILVCSSYTFGLFSDPFTNLQHLQQEFFMFTIYLVTIISHLLVSLQYWPQLILLLTLIICVLTTHCTATISSAQLYTPPSTLMVLYHTQTQPCSCGPQSKYSSFLQLLFNPTHSGSFLCSLPSKYCLKLCKRSTHFFHIHYYPGHP